MMESHRRHSLGHRAFFLFLSRKMRSVLFFFAVDAAVWYSERWLPAEDAPWGDYAAKLILLISIAYFVIVLLRTYLEYRYYTYTFTDEAFVMTYGYVTRNEVAALYHQIQNVNIERGMLDRFAGVSRIIIVLAGAQHDPAHSKIVLPGVGRTKARLVQKELLVRAHRNAMGGAQQQGAPRNDAYARDAQDSVAW